MIKLIVSDVDGTLVPEGGNSLNPEYFSLIRKLKEKGIYFAVASGRHKCSIEKLFAPVRDEIFYITSNGAYMGTYNNKMHTESIPKETCLSLFHHFDTVGEYEYLAETADAAYSSSNDPEFYRLLEEDYGYTMTTLSSMKELKDTVIKLSLYHPENIALIPEDIRKYWDKICKNVVSGKHWIDFNPEAANKGTALARLQSALGVSIHETLAFGDQANDIEMLKQAYFSFAVENAGGAVKNAARFTCDSCKTDGVLHTIEKYF